MELVLMTDVEGVLGVLLPRVLEGVLAHALEGDGLEGAGGDDAVGVGVIAVTGMPRPDT
jgi:hypothetical protein